MGVWKRGARAGTSVSLRSPRLACFRGPSPSLRPVSGPRAGPRVFDPKGGDTRPPCQTSLYLARPLPCARSTDELRAGRLRHVPPQAPANPFTLGRAPPFGAALGRPTLAMAGYGVKGGAPPVGSGEPQSEWRCPGADGSVAETMDVTSRGGRERGTSTAMARALGQASRSVGRGRANVRRRL